MKMKNIRFDQKDVPPTIQKVVSDYTDAEEWQLQQVKETVDAIKSGEMETIPLEQFLKEER